MKYRQHPFLTALLVGLLCVSSVMATNGIHSFGQEITVPVDGKVYAFGENEQYKYSEAKDYAVASPSNAYGKFSISGDMRADGVREGMPSFSVDGDKVSLSKWLKISPTSKCRKIRKSSSILVSFGAT